MRRRLILMRHAKSSWASPGLTDHARPLNDRGRRDAPRVAAALQSLGWSPQAVSSSDSARTRETWEEMSSTFDTCHDVTFTHALYHAGLSDIIDESHSWDDALETILTLGHNPGWQMALYSLSGQDLEMTTANAALLIGEGESWADALTGRWVLTDLLRPKAL